MFISLIDTTGNDMWIKWLQIIIGTFSLTGSGLIILIFFANLNKITPAFELIFQLSISSLINTISHLILFIPPGDTTYNKLTCSIQGALMIFSELSQIIISTTISFYIWRSKAESNPRQKFNWKNRSIYFTFIYIIPLAFSLICLDYIGENGRWCWIARDQLNSLGLGEYLAIWILIFMNLIFGSLTKKITNDDLHAEEQKNSKEYIKKLSRYPIISLCCLLPATIDRILNMVEYSNGSALGINNFFQILSLIFNLIQGFLYAMVSLSSINTDISLKIIFKSCFSLCCNKNKTESDKVHDDLSQYLSNTDNKVTRDSKINNCYDEVTSIVSQGSPNQNQGA